MSEQIFTSCTVAGRSLFMSTMAGSPVFGLLYLTRVMQRPGRSRSRKNILASAKDHTR